MDRKTSSGWIISPVIGQAFINSDKLENESTMIFITYESESGKRHSKYVLCDHGRVSKGLKGKIIAWRFPPAAYKGPGIGKDMNEVSV